MPSTIIAKVGCMFYGSRVTIPCVTVIIVVVFGVIAQHKPNPSPADLNTRSPTEVSGRAVSSGAMGQPGGMLVARKHIERPGELTWLLTGRYCDAGATAGREKHACRVIKAHCS